MFQDRFHTHEPKLPAIEPVLRSSILVTPHSHSLEMKRLAIEDVVVAEPRRFTDSRGYFVETYNRRSFEELGVDVDFVQDNEAFSERAGCLRGLHFQVAPDPQSKLVRVVAGSIFDVVVDLRAESRTFGKWVGTTLSAARGNVLYVPAGFAHSYVTLEPNTLVTYKVDRFYNKAAEVGIRWDDPDIAIAWPMPSASITVSEKDAALPFLRELSAPFRFHRGREGRKARIAGAYTRNVGV